MIQNTEAIPHRNGWQETKLRNYSGLVSSPDLNPTKVMWQDRFKTYCANLSKLFCKGRTSQDLKDLNINLQWLLLRPVKPDIRHLLFHKVEKLQSDLCNFWKPSVHLEMKHDKIPWMIKRALLICQTDWPKFGRNPWKITVTCNNCFDCQCLFRAHNVDKR